MKTYHGDASVNVTVDGRPLACAELAQELRDVLHWEEHRMGAVSRAVLKGVIARLDPEGEIRSERAAGAELSPEEVPY